MHCTLSRNGNLQGERKGGKKKKWKKSAQLSIILTLEMS